MALNPKEVVSETNHTIYKNIYIEKGECKPKSIIVQSKNLLINKTKESSSSEDRIKELSFKQLLDNGRFGDAMTVYMEADEEKLKKYRLILKVYFYDKAKKNPNKIIEEILYYIEIEPKSIDFKLYLAELYRKLGKFKEAIDLLLDLQHYQDMDNLESLNRTIESYIQKLEEMKDFQKLIQFLEDIITRESANQKYIIRLAHLYYKLDNYDRAEELLEELETDPTYSAKVEIIKKNIEQKKRELEQYTDRIPLIKIGSHYGIHLYINGTPIVALLDTGATYTLIDEERVQSLNLKSGIVLDTVGGEINANFAVAESLIVDNIELKNFKLTVAPFKKSGIDGLLGMNFFKKFDFKIDQNKQLLYLKLKE
jgi:clan AA aspartic protease (TIGR02281 family)